MNGREQDQEQGQGKEKGQEQGADSLASAKEGRSVAARIRAKNPSRVPIICSAGEASGWRTRRHKFLVSTRLSAAQFRRFVRSNLRFASEESEGKGDEEDENENKRLKVRLYITKQGLEERFEITDESRSVAALDEQHRSPDGFLYLEYDVQDPTAEKQRQQIVEEVVKELMEEVVTKAIRDLEIAVDEAALGGEEELNEMENKEEEQRKGKEKVDLEDGKKVGNETEELPATALDADDLYKSPIFAPRRRMEAGGKAEGLDAVLYNGFESMVLSDDGKDTVSSGSASGGVDWPSLSRESTVADDAQVIKPTLLTHMKKQEEILRTSASSSPAISAAAAAAATTTAMNIDGGLPAVQTSKVEGCLYTEEDSSKLMDHDEKDWIQVEASGPWENAQQQHQSFKNMLLDTIGQIDINKVVNKEALTSKAASLRRFAATVVARTTSNSDPWETISGSAGATKNQSFAPASPGITEDNESIASTDQDWTCVNFDAGNESFGATFL